MKIYKVNDYEWYMAERIEDLPGLLREGYGEDEIRDMKADGYPIEVPDEELDSLTLYDEVDECDYTFRQFMDKSEPGFFCSTEY